MFFIDEDHINDDGVVEGFHEEDNEYEFADLEEAYVKERIAAMIDPTPPTSNFDPIKIEELPPAQLNDEF